MARTEDTPDGDYQLASHRIQPRLLWNETFYQANTENMQEHTAEGRRTDVLQAADLVLHHNLMHIFTPYLKYHPHHLVSHPSFGHGLTSIIQITSNQLFIHHDVYQSFQ
jgi:hypothetical protein